MQRIALLIMCASISLLLAPTWAHAQIYKFVDENGVINFTSLPPPSRYSYTVLKIPCYASDLSCRGVSWEKVALNTQAFEPEISTAARVNSVDESLIYIGLLALREPPSTFKSVQSVASPAPSLAASLALKSFPSTEAGVRITFGSRLVRIVVATGT